MASPDYPWPTRIVRPQSPHALQHFDVSPPAGATGDLPPNTTAIPAVPYIAKRAAGHRFVIVNERHHASSDRLLTMSLLEPLHEQRFRYLAAERVWHGDAPGLRGYPVSNTGFYAEDVVFAQMIRHARFGLRGGRLRA